MTQPRPDILFCGLGTSAVCYYRCMLPAMTIGADWTGLYGEPPKLYWATGLARNGSPDGEPESKLPHMFDYKVVVLQQPHGFKWANLIDRLREEGVKVIYEVDDYLHGIKHMPDHDFRKQYGTDFLGKAELCMRRCDAMICSTPFIAEQYRHFNKRVYVCKNGLDLRRYDLTKPNRETVNIGWAGATGHRDTILPWLQQVANLMGMRDNTTFVSIGQQFAKWFHPHFGTERSIAVPFAAVEQYPGAMTMIDIALAPSGKGGWWKGKSDLRWLEAGALGIPIIAHPQNYPEIHPGKTGFHARSPEEVLEHLLRLYEDRELRTRVGENARQYVHEHRSIEAMAPQWERVFEEVLAS